MANQTASGVENDSGMTATRVGWTVTTVGRSRMLNELSSAVLDVVT